MQGIYVPAVGSTVDQMATPALTVDLNIMTANIDALFALYRDTTVSVRPHLKTAKTPVIAKMLQAAGARGFCVAKVGEAQIMASAGISDLLITSPVGHPSTASWLAKLVARHSQVKVVVDSLEGAQILSTALAKEEDAGSMDVLIDINVGQNRTGVQPGQSALHLANAVAGLKNLKIIGCQGYEGHLQHIADVQLKRKNVFEAMKLLTETAELLRRNDHVINIVTTGGTGTGRICAEVEGVTEVQPGSFIFMDSSYRAALGEGNLRNALFVLATVLSRPDGQTATIDAGWKSLSVDCGPAVPIDSRWSYRAAGDEHGALTGEGVDSLKVGDRVLLIPSHCDTTLALHELYYVMDKNSLSSTWPIESRGRVQ